MTRFKEALNELRGKHAAKRAKAYMKQHRDTRPVHGTPDQEADAEEATRDPQRPGKRGRYNDTVIAASQGLITTPGGELVSAKKAASTMHKAGKHAVRKARRRLGNLLTVEDQMVRKCPQVRVVEGTLVNLNVTALPS